MATNTKSATVIFAKDIDAYFGLENQSQGIRDLALNKYVDFAEVMAVMKVKSLTGKGHSFDSKDEKILDFFSKFEKGNEFGEIVERVLYESFKFGTCLVGFNKLENKEFKMFVCESTFRPRFVIQDQELIGATFLSQRLTVSAANHFYIKESWNLEKVKRIYFYNKKQIQAGEVIADIPKKYHLKNQENNPYKENGFIPFQDFPNYSFQSVPDWYRCIGLIHQYNNEQQNYSHEILVNQSYMSMLTDETTKKTFQDLIRDGKKPHFIISTMGENDIKMFPQQLSHSEHTLAVQKMTSDIFAHSQMSFNSDLSGGGQTTATEIAKNNSGFVDSCNKSKISHERNMKKLLTKLLIAAGFKDPVFTYKLNENTVLSREQQRADVMERLDRGLLDRVGAIQELDGCTKEEAVEREAKFTLEREKEQEKELQKQMQIADKYTDNDGENEGDDDSNSEVKPIVVADVKPT